ncbi:tetratricopeptide repeat protein [Providencia stuartii]|uniref:tetratricopeptide repeat protein n=1 Tax=Providencia stuartii TaxID=588 RepID=UPI00111FA15B
MALAKRYANGIGLPLNLPLAIEWLTKAATQGDAEAQFYLGWLYAHGKGIPQDDELAFIWMGQAAQQNDAQAQYWLARFYQHGVGAPSIDAWRITGTKRPVSLRTSADV